MALVQWCNDLGSFFRQSPVPPLGERRQQPATGRQHGSAWVISAKLRNTVHVCEIAEQIILDLKFDTRI